MSTEARDALKELGINLDTTDEVKLLNTINEKNLSNQKSNSVAEDRLKRSKEDIEKILETKPISGIEIEYDQLSDKEYVLELIKKVYEQFENDKREFDILANKCLSELEGDR